MDNYLGIIYLSVLLGFLGIVALFVLQQIFKTRKLESQLSKLKKRISQDQGTPEDYYQLGSIYLDKKLYSQSVQLFQKALKSKKLDAEQLAINL